MAISAAVFGVFFHLTTGQHNNMSMRAMAPGVQGSLGAEPAVDLAWLALASMGVFIAGETHSVG